MSKYETPICTVCGEEHSYRNTEDVHYCTRCFAVEQPFLWVRPFSSIHSIDDNGAIYVTGYEFDGPIAYSVEHLLKAQ
jgi:hypothetical protein